jgi:hypothetical protein
MRGYYRAVKRKEPWAMAIAKHPHGSYPWLMAYCYRDIDWVAEMSRPSIFDSIPASAYDAWRGATILVPLK